MLLLLDIGNSRTVIGVCDPVDGSLLNTWNIPTDKTSDANQWRAVLEAKATEEGFKLTAVRDVAISSVVPAVSAAVTSLFRDWLGVEPFVVSHDFDLGIKLGMEHADTVGTDRLCNASAAFYRIGGAAIVADAGTATKIEAVSSQGVFLGGAIAPGIAVSLEALIKRAAQLYDVPLEFPPHSIGRNTVHAMQSGLVLGHLAMIEGMVERFKLEVGAESRVILAGGFGPLFWERSHVFDMHVPDLTLRGLFRIWQLNQTSSTEKRQVG